MAAVPQIDPAKLQLVQELEIEMMADMYNRLVTACHRKCIPVKYHEPELEGDAEDRCVRDLRKAYVQQWTDKDRYTAERCKGESVCLDRCVAKYLDVHERIGKKLSSMSQGDADADLTKINMPDKK